jgi:2-polyprenyl-3-methyl-5-hydroxy-6-metoxy-1,4-benzoquinol methylase
MASHAKVFSARYYAERLGGYGPALERLSAATVERLGMADRLVAPDFHDRIAVIAQLAPAPACPVCGGPAEDAFAVKEWGVSRCRSCGHRWLDDPPPPERVASLYGEDYFANPSFRETDDAALFGYMDYHRDREHIQARLRTVLERASAYAEPGRLLDIGCGPGFFVEAAHEAGWDAWGVELNRHAVAWANEHGLDHVGVGSLDHLDHAEASFDCVTMFDVIEHVHDPRAGLTEAARVLRPGGVLILITPDAGSVAARLLGPRWLEYRRAPEHLHFFTRDSLARLLRDTGFTPLDWRTVGKTTSVETLVADLKFSAPRTFRAVDRAARRLGLADRTVSVDPRTKMCVYARRL